MLTTSGQVLDKPASASIPCPVFCTDLNLYTWWRHQMDRFFLRYWPFLRGIHRSPVNSSHNGQRRGALMFSLLCTWINGWVNNREAGDLRRLRTHYDVNVMNISVPTISRVHYCCMLSRIKPVLAIKIVAASLQREPKFKEKRAKKLEKIENKKRAKVKLKEMDSKIHRKSKTIQKAETPPFLSRSAINRLIPEVPLFQLFWNLVFDLANRRTRSR